MKIIAGLNDAVVNGEGISYSPQDGWSYSGAIEGPKESVKAFIYQLAALGWSFNYECLQSPVARLRYDSAGDPGGGAGTETPSAVWEYFGNRIEIDILEADIANVNSISGADIRTIREAIQNPDPTTAPSLTGNAETLYNLMLGGTRNFRVHVPTLKVTRLVSNTYQVTGSQSNVGRIITASTLQTQEDVSLRLFTLPTTSSGKTGFVWGFYKNFPNIQQAGKQWSIAQEWEYGLWSTFLYGAAL